MAKNGVEIQNFENSKKVPLDILEKHVVSKFGPERRQKSHNPYRKINIQNSIRPSDTLMKNFYTILTDCYSALPINNKGGVSGQL